MSNITAQQILDVLSEAKVVKDANALINDKPLAEQGIDSLDFSGVLFNIEEAFKVTIPDADIDGLKTINDIVSYVNNKK